MMQRVGIEAMNIYAGMSYVDLSELAQYRQLDQQRFSNLMMQEKTVALPYEDPITFAVNAAKPIIDQLNEQERNAIELLIICTESGVDFSISIATYVHDYLNLHKQCRIFEIKQACYSGTAGLQMAASFCLSQVSPGAKALVIMTDISRFLLVQGHDITTMDWNFAEPSGGAGAVALLVSGLPHVFELDIGASGIYSYEIMDTCRPVPDSEAGDADLSLMSYLDCCKYAFQMYQNKVTEADYLNSFQYLAFHTPFGGMVRGVHRKMLRDMYQMGPDKISTDFNVRVMQGLEYCQRIGNIMGGSLYLALAATITNADLSTPKRIGCFSYGSGCASEFFSGVATLQSQKVMQRMPLKQGIEQRYRLSIAEYLSLLDANNVISFGTRDITVDPHQFSAAKKLRQGKSTLYLTKITGFHREYVWEK